MSYECINKCQVSSQFGDDINIELGTKWKFIKKEESFTYETPQLAKVKLDYIYLTDDEGRIVKVNNNKLEKYFKAV